jgi:hypothetical protein
LGRREGSAAGRLPTGYDNTTDAVIRKANTTETPAMRRAIALLALAWAATARAEHAKIELNVSAKGSHETAFVDQTPPDWGKNPRPVAKAKVGEPIKVQYLLTNIYPHKTLENVVVHFFVARHAKPGQKELPSLAEEKNVVLETAFEMDLKPNGKAGARSTFKIDTPGSYLVRIETKNTQSDHEHFAAIELVVE